MASPAERRHDDGGPPELVVVMGSEATARPRPGKPAVWRQVGILEAAVGVVLIALLSIAIPGQWGFIHLQPHPFWIVVLAIAVRYGSPSGYVAGLLGAVAYIVLFITTPGAPHQVPSSPIDLLTPFLLFVGGGVVSELSRSGQRRVAEAEKKLRHTAQALEDLYKTHVQLVEVKTELQKRVIGQPASVASLYDASRRLRTLSRSQIGPAILELATEFLEAEECAYYAFKTGRLRLEAISDDGSGSSTRTRPAVRRTRAGLIGDAVRDGRVVTIRERLAVEGRPALKREPVLMAGPLYWPDGNLAGVVVIEKIQLLKFTPTTERYFQLILDWARDALERASTPARIDPAVADTEGSRPDGALTALRDEFSRARRYGLPLTVLVVPVNGEQAIEEIQRSVRGLDIVDLHHDGDKVILVLPATEADASAAVMPRLKLARFGSAAITPEMAGPEEMLAQATAALETDHTEGTPVLQPS